MECCIDCLKGLAQKTVRLSGGDGGLLSDCYELVEELYENEETPPGISNRLLKHIKNTTGVYDPYVFLKERELRRAKRAIDLLQDSFFDSIEGVVKLSALGNSLDFFTGDGDGFDARGFKFSGDMDKIEEAIYIKGNDVLILGDNVGDFLFDMPLVEFLRSKKKQVHYAVKEHPVQNDLSMPDVIGFGFTKIFDNFISTGTDEVGIRREEMRGKIKHLLEIDAVVIAKGMGNFETLSEYYSERPVIHIMKVKCAAVSGTVGHDVGTHVALVKK